MSARHLIAVVAVAASLAACETVPMGDTGYGPRPSSSAFSAEDFAGGEGYMVSGTTLYHQAGRRAVRNLGPLDL